jgi:hypothetical protein
MCVYENKSIGVLKKKMNRVFSVLPHKRGAKLKKFFEGDKKTLFWVTNNIILGEN